MPPSSNSTTSRDPRRTIPLCGARCSILRAKERGKSLFRSACRLAVTTLVLHQAEGVDAKITREFLEGLQREGSAFACVGCGCHRLLLSYRFDSSSFQSRLRREWGKIPIFFRPTL